MPASGRSAASAPSIVSTWGPLALVAIQLALALFVIYQFQLESRTFFHVMLLAAVGFVVHALLPIEQRLPFFVMLSLGGIVLAMGLVDGASLIALGLAMIGICHLPIRVAWRALLLVATGSLFAVWRLELMPAPWSGAIWPILASMFMFRVALYLHALKHDEKKPTASRTLAYFFMLPNVCFPLFPVIDYTTFRRTYYDRDAADTYATGIKWIARGLLHLVAYRLVYVHFATDPTQLRTLGDLVQFLLATFLLYLRVSGQFHLITGVLHLYGFRLPETHHLYFLASSFTDFWRRINIYWKDFMMKLVYYPSFFRLKRFGGTFALVAATIAVFLATWLLHSYQWFWLRGGFPLEPQDALFWGLLGALVVAGALREMRRSRPRQLTRSTAWNASLAFRTVGTFTLICVLWSLWSADSVMGWLLMWRAAETVETKDVWLLALLFATGLLIAGKPWILPESQAAGRAPSRGTALTLSGATLGALILLGSTAWYAGFAPRLATIVGSLKDSTLNARDRSLQHKGYYENLDNQSRQTAQLWDLRAKKPADWVPLAATPAYRNRNDFLGGELVPDTSIEFMGRPLSTNQWGMRDRERVRAKPEGTYRIALLGPSHVMGSGVADNETIATLLEQRLNQAGLSNRRFEVLNFGVAAYSLTNQLAILRDRVLGFEPDAVFVTDSPHLIEPVVQHLANAAAQRYDIPFPALTDALAQTGVTTLGERGVPVPFESARNALERLGIETRMPWREAEWILRRSGDALVATAFAEIARLARSNGATPVYVALDNVSEPPVVPLPSLQGAHHAGLVVFDLLNVWRGRDAQRLRIAPWDEHPNVAGNRIVADALLGLIRQHRAALRLPTAGE
ncbi:MAG TPA: hypothetical protein VNE58_03245 [Casimicrobiaceae bacterium]|nr:hypothetical protein [Casimicrobiaceae bacterium]